MYMHGNIKGSAVYPDWREAASSGYVIRTSKTEYIQFKLFADYAEKFIWGFSDKKLDRNGKYILLLDSHSSHLFNLHFMSYIEVYNVKVLCFPPHFIHLIHPCLLVTYQKRELFSKENLCTKWIFLEAGKMFSCSQ